MSGPIWLWYLLLLAAVAFLPIYPAEHISGCSRQIFIWQQHWWIQTTPITIYWWWGTAILKIILSVHYPCWIVLGYTVFPNGLRWIGAISNPSLKALLLDGIRHIGAISTPLRKDLLWPSHWHRWGKSSILFHSFALSPFLSLVLNTLNNTTFTTDLTFNSIHQPWFMYNPEISLTMYWYLPFQFDWHTPSLFLMDWCPQVYILKCFYHRTPLAR